MKVLKTKQSELKPVKAEESNKQVNKIFPDIPADRITYSVANVVREIISNRRSVKEVGVDSLINLMEMKECLDKLQDTFTKAYSAIFEPYPDIKKVEKMLPGNMVSINYSFEGHENEKSIRDNLYKLNSKEVTIKPFKFMSKNEFFAFTEGMAIGDLVFLKKILMKP